MLKQSFYRIQAIAGQWFKSDQIAAHAKYFVVHNMSLFCKIVSVPILIQTFI